MSDYENGIIGLGSRTTLHYINQINSQFNNKKGGYNTFPFLLLNANFENINPYLPNQYDKVNEQLLPLIQKAKQTGLKRLLFPNITIHETLYEYPALTEGIQLIDPINEVISVINTNQPVLIIGSAYTSYSSNLAKRFKDVGIRVNTNETATTDWVNDFRIKVYYEKETKEEVTVFNDLMESLAQNQSVLIACTELSTVLHTRHNNVFDLVGIQIKAFIK